MPWRDHSDSDITLQVAVEDFANGRHATLADLLEDVVATEGVTNQIEHLIAFTTQLLWFGHDTR